MLSLLWWPLLLLKQQYKSNKYQLFTLGLLLQINQSEEICEKQLSVVGFSVVGFRTGPISPSKLFILSVCNEIVELLELELSRF